MPPGVGKTTAMLKAAHAAKAQGIDIVAGYVEPHPRRKHPHCLMVLNSSRFSVFPTEMSPLMNLMWMRRWRASRKFFWWTNWPTPTRTAAATPKRYQDVEEILRAGISVWTTVNVQHLESLNDLVASITGVVVHERLPDNVFDQADQVELVDIEPKELILRLKAGKIYREKQAQRALEHFFLPANLTGLREIALAPHGGSGQSCRPG